MASVGKSNDSGAYDWTKTYERWNEWEVRQAAPVTFRVLMRSAAVRNRQGGQTGFWLMYSPRASQLHLHADDLTIA